MDNGLCSALFRWITVIVEHYEELISVQWRRVTNEDGESALWCALGITHGLCKSQFQPADRRPRPRPRGCAAV